MPGDLYGVLCCCLKFNFPLCLLFVAGLWHLPCCNDFVECFLEFSLAALKGVIQNIRINLKSLKDPETVAMEQLKIKLFLEDSDQIYRNAITELERKL